MRRSIPLALVLVVLVVSVAALVVRGQTPSQGDPIVNKQRSPASPTVDKAASAPRDRIINQENPGETIELEQFLVPGKINIFDFYSKYCPPCMRMAPLLEKLAEKRTDVVVNKVDINRPEIQGIDWQSPVARQYNLASIPHFKVYAADGTVLAEDQTASQMVIDMLNVSKVQETDK